jgi:hypothetical protein
MKFILSNITNRLQQQNLGAGETKGEENEFQKYLDAAEGFQLDEVEDETEDKNEGGEEPEEDGEYAEEQSLKAEEEKIKQSFTPTKKKKKKPFTPIFKFGGGEEPEEDGEYAEEQSLKAEEEKIKQSFTPTKKKKKKPFTPIFKFGGKEMTGSGYVIRGGALGDNDYLQFIKDYNDYKSSLYQESINSLKQKPIFSKADAIYKSSKLQNYEGTASNVLRDIMITTGSMTTNIRNNRVNINQGITMDPKLVKSIKQDNDVIMNRFIPVLEEHPEVERNYKETFEKVLNNLKYINVFVLEL